MSSNSNIKLPGLSARTVLGVLGLLCFLALTALSVSHEMGLFKSMPINGAFQLYNPLHRLAAGESIGGDFDFFHGSGTLLLHYPIFSLFGGNLWASELSRHLMGFLAFLACFHVCAAAWKIPGYLASLAACGTLVIGEAVMHGSGALCGSSMMGLRSSLPALVFPTVIWLSRRVDFVAKPLGFHLLLGIGLGATMFVATEQGLAAIGVYGLLILMVPVVAKRPLARVGWAVFTGTMGIITFIACVAMATNGHTLESLQFALIDLPKEQFWYFGAPPNRIPQFPNMLWNGLAVIGIWLPLILLGCEIARYRSTTGKLLDMPVDSALVVILLSLALVVQIPQLASYSHYQNVSTRNMGLVGMLWIFRWVSRGEPHGTSVLVRLQSLRVPIQAFVAVLLIAAMGCIGISRVLQHKRRSKASDVQYAGMPVAKGWASDLKVWRQLAFSGAKVASSYRTMIEDETGSAFRGPDYIIHALGDRRPRFLQNLISYKPDFFLTINPDYTQYEEWVQLRHWNVYQHLIHHYTPTRASDFHVFWKRRVDPTQQSPNHPAASAAMPMGTFWQSPVNMGDTAVFSVKVCYAVENPLGAIPVAGKLTRYLLSRETLADTTVTTHIPASLPPTESSWEFPIILKQGEHARFELKLVMALPGASATIQSIALEEVSRDAMVIAALSDGGKLLLVDSSHSTSPTNGHPK